jgi:hypothetical protein
MTPHEPGALMDCRAEVHPDKPCVDEDMVGDDPRCHCGACMCVLCPAPDQPAHYLGCDQTF